MVIVMISVNRKENKVPVSRKKESKLLTVSRKSHNTIEILLKLELKSSQCNRVNKYLRLQNNFVRDRPGNKNFRSRYPEVSQSAERLKKSMPSQ